MFTLQILDRGQSFLHSLDASAVVIGSDPGADICLTEAGVRPQHVRLEPLPDGVRLQAIGDVVVNGRTVRSAELALGDRIEIGKAVVVVGRSVTRRTRPDEVLADARTSGRAARTASTKKKHAWLPFAVAGLVLAGVVAFIAQGDDTVLIRNELAAVARLREAGDLEPAAAAIGRLRQQWADATDDRLLQLDAEQGRLDAIHGEVERLTAQVLDPAIDRSYAQWMIELRRLEGGGQPAERVAARRVRGVLRETLEQRPRPVVAEAPPVAETSPDAVPASTPAPVEPTPVAVVPPPVAPPAPQPAGDVPSDDAHADAATVQSQAPTDPVDVIRGEADRLVQKGLFVQAIAVLQDALAATADPAHAQALQRHWLELRDDAVRHAQVLAAQAKQAVRVGNAAEAVALLREAQPRFPSSAEFDVLARTLREALEEVDDEPAQPAAMAAASAPGGGGDGSAPTSALLELRSHLEAIRRAEEDGAFATAGRLLREAAGLLRERDPAFADRLLGRAEAADLEAAWHEHVAAAIAAGRTTKVTTREGRAVTVHGAVDERLAVATANGDERLPWTQVSPFGLSLLVDQTAPSAEAALGAAVLYYGGGDAQRAEALLAKVLRASPGLKQAIDGVLARGRGEPVDERGYTFGREGFVSVRATELQKEATKLLARLDAALRDRDPAARDNLVDEVMTGGPDALAVLTTAMHKEFERQLAKIEASPVQKQLERLGEQRALLDAARDHARSLIYDEVKYFYPYKPPAVSSDKFAEYNRVQAEVDRRVDALRAVWKDDRVRVRVPATLRSDIERLDWAAKVLGTLQPFDDSRLASVAWARAVPALDTVGLREHCRTAEERQEREQWRLVEAYNDLAGKSLPSSVREQLRITNDYRAMFGHRPLAVVRSVCEAAQGHAEEMSRLGYFAHMSPTPGRRTPYDRMQLAGYLQGVSENIALCDGALSAHNAWCTSSGHHRNLLDPSHHEMGVGADGRNWVQNFGSGRVHEQDPAWAAVTGTKGR
jgi:tetratricopeptide (TPR) repeat protein